MDFCKKQGDEAAMSAHAGHDRANGLNALVLKFRSFAVDSSPKQHYCVGQQSRIQIAAMILIS